MRIATDEVLIIGYGQWDIDGEPVKRADGSPAEYVDVLDLAENQGYRWSLAPEVNGERPKELTKCRLEGELRERERNGRRRLGIVVDTFLKV